MKRYYCNGKKGYCDRGNDKNISCQDCEFANGTGGEIVDVPQTNYECIKNMSVEELASILSTHEDCEKYCTYTKDGKCNKFQGDGKGGCADGVKQWLESEVTEE